MKKKICVFMLIIILCFCWTCDSTTKSVVGDLIGIWHLTNFELLFKIITNSNQTVIDMASEAIGSIDLTGDVNGSLLYMDIMDYDGYVSITASNSELYDMTYPKYSLSITSGSDYTGYQLTVQQDESSYTLYQTDSANYTYDANTYTLTINSAIFYKFDMTNYQIDSNSVIIVNGTLQNQLINISANTPTEVDMGWGSEESSESTVSIEKDGSWTRTTNDVFDGMTETATGTWEIVDGKLVVIENYQLQGITVTDTIEFEYEVSNNNLIFKYEEDWCELDEEYTEEQCFENVELMLGLDDGSLTDITILQTMTFSSNPPVMKVIPKFQDQFLFKNRLNRLNQIGQLKFK